MKFYLKPEKLTKFVKAHGKGAPRLLQRACVLCRPGEENDVEASGKQLRNSAKNLVTRFDASVEEACPGTKSATA